MKNQFNAKVDADFGWTGMADTQMWLFSLPGNSLSLTIYILVDVLLGEKGTI